MTFSPHRQTNKHGLLRVDKIMPRRRSRRLRRWFVRMCLVNSTVDSSDSSESEIQASRRSITWDDPLPSPPPNPVTENTTPLAASSVTEGDWRFPPPPPPPFLNDDSVQPVIREIDIRNFELDSESPGYTYDHYENDTREEMIDVIRRMRITEKYAREKMVCPICKEELRVGEEAMELPCNHSYCCECIRSWLNDHSTCPVCRRHLYSWDFHSPLQISSPSPRIDAWHNRLNLTEESDFSNSPSAPNSEAGYDTAREDLDESHASSFIT